MFPPGLDDAARVELLDTEEPDACRHISMFMKLSMTNVQWIDC
jgi:hypothetical protein